MSIQCTLFQMPVHINGAAVFFSTVAQQMVSLFWYGLAFSSVYCYYYAADKGVKRAEYAVRRYAQSFQICSTLLSNLLRALAISVVLSLLNLKEEYHYLGTYVEVGLAVAAVTFIPIASDFWAERPLPLIFINSGHLVANALAAATVLFYTRDILWFGAAINNAIVEAEN